MSIEQLKDMGGFIGDINCSTRDSETQIEHAFFPKFNEIDLSIVSMGGFISHSYLGGLDYDKLSFVSHTILSTYDFNPRISEHIEVLIQLFEKRFLNKPFQKFINAKFILPTEKSNFIHWYNHASFLIASNYSKYKELLPNQSSELSNVDVVVLNLYNHGKSYEEIAKDYLESNPRFISALHQFLTNGGICNE